MDDNLLLSKLIPIAQNAGSAILEIYKKGIETSFKEDGSPVTNADKKSEEIILSGIKSITNEFEIISEENSASHKIIPSSSFFLVDPIDGTKEFLRKDGLGAFTVNIALIKNKKSTLGVVYAPALGRLFYGSINNGAYETFKGKTKNIKIREIPLNGPLAVASKSHKDKSTENWLLNNNINKTISTGSSVKFCLIASGEADVYPRFGPTMEWDTAAGDAVLCSAGGKVVNPDGSDFLYAKQNYKNGPFIALGNFKL